MERRSLDSADAAGRLRSVAVIPELKLPDMWRVKRPDDILTDMVDRMRARDATRSIVLAALNGQETASGGPQLGFADRVGPMKHTTRKHSKAAVSGKPTKRVSTGPKIRNGTRTTRGKSHRRSGFIGLL
jgi:hypothetical protein